MPWIGDIHVPFITGKDTSIDKEFVEKNFVDSPPQVFEVDSNLESGNYSVVLNEQIHERTEDLEEQTDAIRSLAQRHPTECPYTDASDQGFLVVEESSVSRSVQNSIRNGDISIRFLPNDAYKPACQLKTSNEFEGYSPSNTSSVFPLPSIVENVQIDGDSVSPSFTISTKDGDMDFYSFESGLIEYDFPDASFDEPERTSPVRIYGSETDGNYGSSYGDSYSGSLTLQDDRVYTKYANLPGYATVENGKLLFLGRGNNYIYEYVAGSWEFIGHIPLDYNYKNSEENSNLEGILNLGDNYNLEIYRGLPILKFEVSNEERFTFISENDLSLVEETSEYVVSNDGNRDIILCRESYDGTIYSDISKLEVRNINYNNKYTFYIGIVPNNLVNREYSDYVLNKGEWKQTMIQR